jgi:uncharacterized protein YhfF
MQVHEDVIQLGGEDDEGAGELLTQRILAGVKTVLTTPEEVLDDDERAEIAAGVGREMTLIDPEGEPVANLRITDVFRTTWGAPDPRLVAGEGFRDDIQHFRATMADLIAADLDIETPELRGDTVLLVERFELLETAE